MARLWLRCRKARARGKASERRQAWSAGCRTIGVLRASKGTSRTSARRRSAAAATAANIRLRSAGVGTSASVHATARGFCAPPGAASSSTALL